MKIMPLLPEIILTVTTLVSANGWFQSRKQRKAKEADFLEIAAKQNIENAQSVVDMFQRAVVSPLKKEVKYLRCELKTFRLAVEKIPNCPASADCPITEELKNKNNFENEDFTDDAVLDSLDGRFHRMRNVRKYTRTNDPNDS